MAIQQRTQPSIYLTFKVLQFVNQLRRRLKLRVPHSPNPSLLGSETSLGLDSKALTNIARGLSRLGLQERKLSHQASNRVCKGTKNRRVRPSLKLKTPGQDDPVNQNNSGGEVQRMLNSVDEKLSPPGSALSAIAASDGLFLKQNTTANLDAFTLKETISSLVCVFDAISVLNACRARYDDGWLVAQGQECGLAIDGSFVDNYEHLLLALQSQLIDVLERKVIEALLDGNHDKQQRRLLGWFTEFSGKPRPLSTFPWTIKPSLAVLWGVCWMFYNSKEGSSRVPQAKLLQNVDFSGWSAPGPSEYREFGFELTGTQPQPSTQQLLAGNGGSVGLGNVSSQYPDLSGGQMAHMSRARAAPPPNLQGSQNISTYFPAQFPQTFSTTHEHNSLPGNSGHAPLIVFPQHQHQHHLNSLDQSWQLSHSSLPQRPARHLTSIPSVRVTAESETYAQPQPDFASFDLYQAATQDPQAPSLEVITNLFDSTAPTFIMGNCQPPETSPIHPPHSIRHHERTSSINSNSNIPTPVSMAGPRSPLLSPVGDRRPSIASSHGHMRQPSEDRSSNSGDEDSPRRNSTAFKRAEEPPRNQEGKMVCKHSECVGQTFDRKCEWSKHMDKHDRPYKCNVKGCEKLQGFTYSGGLLRHEREVHKMHGGTKKSLYCPFADCKRSSGSGFTRKENLAEHIRRVHRRTSLSTDLGGLVIPRPPRRDDTEEPRFPAESFSRILESRDEEDQFSLKRKRIPDSGTSEHGDEDLRAEVKRLRKENEEKDDRLKQLEAAVAMLQRSARS